MSNFPAVNGKQVVRAVLNLGFHLDRVTGSHHIMVKEGLLFDPSPRACIEGATGWNSCEHPSDGRRYQEDIFREHTKSDSRGAALRAGADFAEVVEGIDPRPVAV